MDLGEHILCAPRWLRLDYGNGFYVLCNNCNRRYSFHHGKDYRHDLKLLNSFPAAFPSPLFPVRALSMEYTRANDLS